MRAEVNFKYIDETSKQHHYYFTDPVKVVNVNHADEVKLAFDEAEQSDMYVLVEMKYEASQLFDPLLKVHETDKDLIRLYYFKDFAKAPVENNNKVSHDLSFKFTEQKDEIISKVHQIQEEIKQGNTYQVNYTTRLKSPCEHADLYEIYSQLSNNHGNYTAYIEDDDHTIASISPELFFQYDMQSKAILTKPMKGTMPTHSDSAIDEKNYQFLKHSIKDKAENVMIVDLLRNDLSKIAKRGTVQVPHLFTIEKFLSVYQMTSTITANIGNHTLFDILKSLFPCGSITGAPKQSTMNIINQLEATPRSIYCGAIGLIIPHHVAIFNVPIRTLEYQKSTQEVTYGVGGGITIDSLPELEYEEMLAKSNVLHHIRQPMLAEDNLQDFHLIETMRIEAGEIKRKTYHMTRLEKALKSFGFKYDRTRLEETFNITLHKQSPHMYRVTAYPNGKFQTTILPIKAGTNTAKLSVMNFAEEKYHHYKTSVRYQYGNDKLTLFHDGEFITEFNIGNAVIDYNGGLYTPNHPLILNGCMRQSLVDQKIIQECEIELVKFLEYYDKGLIKLYMINSLREWVEVKLCY